jgi:hypothetical protein
MLDETVKMFQSMDGRQGCLPKVLRTLGLSFALCANYKLRKRHGCRRHGWRLVSNSA